MSPGGLSWRWNRCWPGHGTAKEAGAHRFCMGWAWRDIRDGAPFEAMLAMVRGVRELGMEACVTAGMLTDRQAERLAEAGLTSYNHNLDTQPRALRPDHHHPDLSGALGDPAAGAPRRDFDVLWGHHRHGGEPDGPGLFAAGARLDGPPPGERPDQRSGGGGGHTPWRISPRWIPSSSSG